MASVKSVDRALELIKGGDSKILGLKVGTVDVKPGDFIPRANAQSSPALSLASATPDKTYVLISLDLDAPFPSFNIMSPILHQTQSGLQAAEGSTELKSSAPSIADYVAPRPPPGSGPHRYVFMLYEQPADFEVSKYAPADGKPAGVTSRIRYNLEAFESKAKLGPCIAANYFTSN